MRRALIAVALLTSLAAAGGVWVASAPAAQPASPVEVYSRECGACHMAYPPQLLPARSWHALIGGLDKHFGENASLDPATAQTIAAYLAANAADTLGPGARPLWGIGPTDVPLRITETPFWISIHEEISPARFRSPQVKSKSNCLACHQQGGGGDEE